MITVADQAQAWLALIDALDQLCRVLDRYRTGGLDAVDAASSIDPLASTALRAVLDGHLEPAWTRR